MEGLDYSVLVHSLTEEHLDSFYFRAALWSTTTTMICPNFSVDTYFLFWSRWVNGDYRNYTVSEELYMASHRAAPFYTISHV